MAYPYLLQAAHLSLRHITACLGRQPENLLFFSSLCLQTPQGRGKQGEGWGGGASCLLHQASAFSPSPSCFSTLLPDLPSPWRICCCWCCCCCCYCYSCCCCCLPFSVSFSELSLSFSHGISKATCQTEGLVFVNLISDWDHSLPESYFLNTLVFNQPEVHQQFLI